MNLKDFSSTQKIDSNKSTKEKAGEQNSKKDAEQEKIKSAQANSFTQNADFEKILESDEFKKVENEYGDIIQDFVSKYGEMDEADIISEILRLIAIKKQEGTFDPTLIRNLATQIAPMLNEEQHAKMNYLLSILD